MQSSFEKLELFHQPGSTDESEKVVDPKLANLKRFWLRVHDCKSLPDLYLLVREFAKRDTTLLERSDLSTIYTAKAVGLSKDEGVNEFLVLDELALICWSRIGE